MIATAAYAIFGWIAGVLFIGLSLILLYQSEPQFLRWVRFALGYACAYSLICVWLFGRWPAPVASVLASPQGVESIRTVALLGMPVVVAGFCAVRQLSMGQSVGVLAAYFAVAVAVMLAAGVISHAALARYVILAPYVLFLAGTPLLLGYAMFRGAACGNIAGLLVAWSCTLVLVNVAITNLFGVPFGLEYEMSQQASRWIQLGVGCAGVLGILAVPAYGWMHEWSGRTIFGALILYTVGVLGAVVLVQLTLGWQVLFPAWKQ